MCIFFLSILAYIQCLPLCKAMHASNSWCFSLLCKDEEGRSGPFVDKIREQEKLEKAMYIKDIENALGGSR